MKFKYLLIMFLTLIMLPIGVFAEGDVSVSNSRLSITKGGTTSFVITANNSAGRVDVTSSNSSIASVSESSIFLDDGSSTITVTGNSVGTTTITVYLNDVTTYDDEEISGKSYTINVTVAEPVIVTPKSDNNNLESITVEGYELEKINDKEYNLSVRNDVSSVNIITTLEDETASVNGDGIKQLNVGDNLIEIIVTSESGKENKYIININRKDGYYLEDLPLLLKEQNDINIKIKSDSIVSSDILKQLKDGKKKLTLHYNDDNDKIVYSWLIDGNKLNETSEFLTSVSYISEYKKDIEKITNYADGLYINVKNTKKISDGLKLKINVSDKFDNGNNLKLYCYNKTDNSLKFISDKINVKSQYIEFDVNNCSNYFVTMSNLDESNNESFNIFIIISIILLVICLILLILLNKKNKNKNNAIKNDKSDLNNDLNNFGENTDIIMSNNSLDNTSYNETSNIDVQNENNVNFPETSIYTDNFNVNNNENISQSLFPSDIVPPVSNNYVDTYNTNNSTSGIDSNNTLDNQVSFPGFSVNSDNNN